MRNQLRSVRGLPNFDAAIGDGTIFEDLISRYNKLAEHSADLLVKQIAAEVESDLKAHLFK